MPEEDPSRTGMVLTTNIGTLGTITRLLKRREQASRRTSVRVRHQPTNQPVKESDMGKTARTDASNIAVSMQTPDFSRGFVCGLTGIYGEDDTPWFNLDRGANEVTIIEIMQNTTELAEEHELTDEILRFSAGLIAGLVMRPVQRQES
jgi:hypothetical protein